MAGHLRGSTCVLGWAALLLLLLIAPFPGLLYAYAELIDQADDRTLSVTSPAAMPTAPGRASWMGLPQLVQSSYTKALTASSKYRVITLLALLVVPCLFYTRQFLSMKRRRPSIDEEPGNVSDSIGTDAITTDPGLLKKHSIYTRYFVPATGFTYPSIRTFYRPHPQGDKLPSDPPLPLLVFIHGLGGSVAQFHTLLSSLVNCADSLAIDLPGCGLSRFSPRTWQAYTTESLVHLIAVIVDQHRNKANGQGAILICHSMGCSLGALLASSTSPYATLMSECVQGLVAICPVAEPPDEEHASKFRKLLNTPGWLFDIWRRWDRRGGTESASVARFAGLDAEEETKKLQVRFNEQSRTPVWRRMAYGSLPEYVNGQAIGGIPGKSVWAGIKISTYLLAGEADPITKAENVEEIAGYMGKSGGSEQENDTVADGLATLDARSKQIFRTLVLPAPASHALLYAPRTARPLSGHIQTFLTAIDPRLSLGWQLQTLSKGGKWDVKNLSKWKAVQPVSTPIAGLFRAMKTLREVDETHAPKIFVKEWATSSGMGKDGLGPIVVIADISHETPVYDPRGLEEGGIAYRKFPTVSKLPPTVDEVKAFIDLIDGLRTEFLPALEETGPPRLIGVHCHYGFNRTGFFIIAYLVEKLGWKLSDALAEFGNARPPGVRHSHFVDELSARYWTRGEDST